MVPITLEDIMYKTPELSPAKIVEYPSEAKSWAYANGLCSPHYPVPATCETSAIANNHVWLTGHCPEPDGPCLSCIVEYLDGLEETTFLIAFGY